MRRRGAGRSPAWLAAVLALVLACAARADDTPAAGPAPDAAAPAQQQPPAEPPPPTEPKPAAEPKPAEAAADQIGRSIFVVNDVDGRVADVPPRHLAVNDDVVFEEDITTGADAKTVIEFRDGSTFEMGPDAVIRIDTFIFNPEESTSEKSVQVTHGVFRYVSGYVASNQNTKIVTPTGTLGIRGSVAAGIVDPEVPDFIYVGDGAATFTNQAGSAELQPGNAIAVPSPSTPPMAPAAMPPAVAAQALQAIEKRLPPPQALRNRPAADEAWLRRAGAANLVPAAVQQQRAAAMARGGPLPKPAARGALAGELGLLVEGNRVNLFAGRQTTRTPEQTAFVTRAARENPNAAAAIRRFTGDARALHTASTATATALVLRGVGRAAPSAETMRRVTAASLRANPGAAALINRHATEAIRHRDNERGHPDARTPPERRERAASARSKQPKPPQPQKAAPKPPPKREIPQKEPPKKKKGDEKQQEQQH